MLLAQYLKERTISLTEFATACRIPYQTLYSTIKKPHVIPSADLCLRIIEGTGGAVTLSDLVKTSKYPRRGFRLPGEVEVPASPDLENNSQQGSPACG